MPQHVNDLRAAEFGDKIVAEFTIRPVTTEGLPLKSVRSVEVYVGVAPNPFSDAAFAVVAKRYPVTATGAGPLTKEIPISEWVGKTVAINVRATGPKGKTSDWSNYFTLQVNPALPTPADAKAESLPMGIAATWKGPADAHYHVYRAAGGESPTLLDSVNDPRYLDSMTDFGTSYQYFIENFQDNLHQSETAHTQAVLREDTFAPSVPVGLTAEPGASSIELSWERNTDPRFQGYNVFRSVDGGEFQKVAPLIAAPAYSDHTVQSGKRYRYQVSAVGINGLESARSAPVEVTAQ